MHHPTYRMTHTTVFVTPVVEHWLEWEILNGFTMKDRSAGFLSQCLSGPLSYVRRHITVNKMCSSATLNKTFPSFLYQQSCFYLFLTERKGGNSVSRLKCLAWVVCFRENTTKYTSVDDNRNIWGGYNWYTERINLYTHHGYKYYSTSPLKSNTENGVWMGMGRGESF